jgi:hypothetical protein
MKRTVLLKPLETMGYSLEFFQIANPDSTGRVFTYYTFDEGYRPELVDVWDIIGLRIQRDEPLLLDVRCMNIEIDMFERGEFVALRDAPSYVSLLPARVHALIEFFESLQKERPVIKGTITHFRLMSADDLEVIHMPARHIPLFVGRTYQHILSERGQNHEEISMFSFPGWSSKYGANQTALLQCMTFREQQLADPLFTPFPSFGRSREVSTVTFDQRALEEFVILLKQYSYEAFVRTQQTQA